MKDREESMATDSYGKRVLVLSDDHRLSRAIELNLRKRLGVEVVTVASNSLEQRGSPTRNDGFDLIVVAMSSPVSEPVVALARASLVKHIGRVPLLIISDRPFDPDPDDQIAHLEFPFDASALHDKVQGLLQGEP